MALQTLGLMGIVKRKKLTVNQVYGLKYRNKLPKPDGFVDDHPFWYPATIDAWTPPAKKVAT